MRTAALLLLGLLALFCDISSAYAGCAVPSPFLHPPKFIRYEYNLSMNDNSFATLGDEPHLKFDPAGISSFIYLAAFLALANLLFRLAGKRSAAPSRLLRVLGTKSQKLKGLILLLLVFGAWTMYRSYTEKPCNDIIEMPLNPTAQESPPAAK